MESLGLKRPYSPAEDQTSDKAEIEFMPQLSLKRKLIGREFYESIGSPKRVLAPMVDRSEFAWRMLTKSFMPPQSDKILSYTPMLHARLFTETSRFRDMHFQPTRDGLERPGPGPQCIPYLDGNPAIDRPLFVQFCANDPGDLLGAARYVEPYCDAIDLNLGCPQGIARKGHYGAFLQEDWETIHSLINTLHTSLSIPVTAKLRILETKEKTLEYARMVLSAGASIITVHGRQREQKGHNMGLADWSALRYLREHLPADTVIFANGNILGRDDFVKCLEETGADAVMSAEGNLSDPTIFAQPPSIDQSSREYWRGSDGQGGYRLDGVVRRYLDIIYKYVVEVDPPARQPLFISTDPPSTQILQIESPKKVSSSDTQPAQKKRKSTKTRTESPNLGPMQGHLFHMLRPLVSKHTHIRDALARTRAGDLQAFENVLAMIEEAVKQGILEYEADPEKFNDSAALQPIENGAQIKDDDTLVTIAKYRRPWWVCQPYIRPSPKEAYEKGSMTLSKQDKKRMESNDVENNRDVGHEKGRKASHLSDKDIEAVEVSKEELVSG